MRPIANIVVALAVVSGGVLTGCGGSAGPPPSPAASDGITTVPTSTTVAPTPDIVISNYGYQVRGPLRPGQQVIIVNDDQASHSLVTDGSDALDVRVSGGGGVETVTAPTTPGTYQFHCKYHANMHGSLVVQ